jgi:transcriptional regulator with XRE-family HTH domain
MDMRMSLEALAEDVDVSPERLAAFEAGALRVPARTLADVCHVLDVSPQFLFEADSGADEPSRPNEGLKWIEALTRIRDPELRRAVIHFAENVAQMRY